MDAESSVRYVSDRHSVQRSANESSGICEVFCQSTDVWATRRLGDRFFDDHLGDTGWTSRRQQYWTFGSLRISVLGRGLLPASRLQRRFSLCKSVLERLWTLLKCVPQQLIADNRLHDPRRCGCSRRNASFLSPRRLYACRSNDQLLSPKRPMSPKWSSQTRKASCRWQTRATLAKRLQGLRKSSGVVSCS